MEILIFFLGAGFGAALGIFMLALVSVNDARRPASHKKTESAGDYGRFFLTSSRTGLRVNS